MIRVLLLSSTHCRNQIGCVSRRTDAILSPAAAQRAPGGLERRNDLQKDLTDSRKGTILGPVTPAPDYADQLRAADLRVTRPRLAVLEAVHSHPHADTESIFGAVRAGLPEVSRQAVYDVLAALTAAGLVRKIQPSGSVARYESRVGDNHHHVVCRSCGVIADVDCAVGEAPCLTPSDEEGALDGFVLDEAEVIYWGLCPDCSAAQASRSHP
jgi:Fe2+ or Zn2+ uptake regulation protein